MTDEKQKYKHFRNFMVNELGITKADIEAWTKEAVADRVEKIVKGMNFDKMARDQVHRIVTTGHALRLERVAAKVIADSIVGKVEVRLK